MRITYRSIISEIDKAVDTAEINGRTIEKIELSCAEWEEYKREIRELWPNAVFSGKVTYREVPICKYEPGL